MIAATYIINLAASTERWRDMQPLLDRMQAPNPLRFDAVDGAALGPEGMLAKQAAGLLSPDTSRFDAGCKIGEIGCALSHAGVLRDIVERGLPAAMVLEDDIVLDGAARSWPSRFAAAFADLPPTWELWYLYRCFDIEHRVQRISPRTVIPWTPQGGAAYAVTLEGARKLLAAMTPVSDAVDRVYEKVVKAREIEALAASPLLIRPGAHPSIINRGNPSKQWVKNGVNRPPEYWPEKYLAHLGEAVPPKARPGPGRKPHDQPRPPAAIPGSVYFVVWWFDRFGGMERHVTDIAVALARRGIRVSVFCETPLSPSNQYGKALRAAGVTVVAPRMTASLAARLEQWLLDRLPAGLAARRGAIDPDDYLRHRVSLTTRALIGAMERHARQSPPGIVHVHGCRLSQHPMLLWASSHGYPAVYTEHVTIADWGGPFDEDAPSVVCRAADAIACVSEHSRASLRQFLPWTGELHVAHHMVRDPLPHDRAAGPHRPMASPASILAVGRLVRHKGYETLLQAAALLRDQGVAVDIKIAGSGEQLADLRKLRTGLGLEESVTFLGQLQQAQVAELWRSADIAVVPSLTEGLPLAVIEAMAQGMPVVATRVGGIPEVVRHEENGLLVEPGDAAALAAAIRRVIDDPALADRIAREARRSFEQGGWSEESVVAQTLAIYDEARRSRAARTVRQDDDDLLWAREQAQASVRPMKRVCLFIWDLAAVGDMERLVAEQAAALAAAGLEVLLFIETPVSRFNRHVRAVRRAGVRIVAPSRAASLAHRTRSRIAGRQASTPMSRAFAKACAGRRPDAIHIHGWRLGCGWDSLSPIISLAHDLGVASVYCEHAVENGEMAPPDEVELAAIRMADALSASSGAGADYLVEALGEPRPVTVVRHAVDQSMEPPNLDPSHGLRAFSLLPPVETAALARTVDPDAIQIDPAGPPAGHASQIAACDAVVLSPELEGFAVALAEAMSAFKPVVICGLSPATPIRNHANGLACASDPAAALAQLASDPLLARQFAVAARRTFDQGGLRDLAIAGETVALYRAADQNRAKADAGR